MGTHTANNTTTARFRRVRKTLRGASGDPGALRILRIQVMIESLRTQNALGSEVHGFAARTRVKQNQMDSQTQTRYFYFNLGLMRWQWARDP